MKKYFIGLMALSTLLSCGKKQEAAQGLLFRVPVYMKTQIAALKKANPSISKTLVWGEELRSAEEDSVDWDRELALWERMDLNRAEWASTFDSTVKPTPDGGRFVLYETREQQPMLRSVTLLYNKQNELLVLEADWEEHNFWMHRSYRLSYLPGKGYNVKGWQQALWEERKEFEIFADIHNRSFLEY